MIQDYSIVYLKNITIQDEIEAENFCLDLKKRIYESTEDVTLIKTESRRMFQSAHVGQYAGVFIDFMVTGIPLVYTYYEIWKTIFEHLKSSKEKGKIIRVNNLTTLENLCKYDLVVNKGVIDAEIVSSTVLYDKYDMTDDGKHKFYYEGPIQDEIAARIVFENDDKRFIYSILTDGNISSYDRQNK